jgi:tetratricopeptide (TPR) repeat protein
LHPESVYQELKSIDGELAFAVERLVPGEAGELPAFAAESLLSDLRSYADLAERHLRTTEQVSAVASFRELGASHVVAVLQDAMGMPQAHYALEVPPSSVSWLEQDGRRRARFALSGRVVDDNERELNRWEDDLDVETRASEANEAPLSFQGRIALVPGRFRLDLSLTNTTGGGTYLASVPMVVEEESPGLSEIVLARSRRRLEGGELLDRLPFQLGDQVLSPSPDRVFPPVEAFAYLQQWDVPSEAQVEWALSRDGRAVWRETSALAPSRERWLNVEQRVPLEGLAAGTYTLDAVVPSSPSGRRTIGLTVAPAKSLEAVRVLAREGFPAGHGRLRYERGVLFSRLGDSERAIEEMTAAAELLPRDLEIHLKLAFLLNARRRHQEVIDRLEPLLPHYPQERDLLVFLGVASLALGRPENAVRYYETALAQSPDDPELQKALARARESDRRH